MTTLNKSPGCKYLNSSSLSPWNGLTTTTIPPMETKLSRYGSATLAIHCSRLSDSSIKFINIVVAEMVSESSNIKVAGAVPDSSSQFEDDAGLPCTVDDILLSEDEWGPALSLNFCRASWYCSVSSEMARAPSGPLLINKSPSSVTLSGVKLLIAILETPEFADFLSPYLANWASRSHGAASAAVRRWREAPAYTRSYIL